MYYRPDDTESQSSANYMILVGWQHQIATVALFVILFFNFPFFFFLMVPGLNWIVYGIAIIINSLIQLLLFIQYTFLIVVGWFWWIITLVVFGGPLFMWILFQWFRGFALIANILFPGILMAIWLLPLNVGLANDEGL